MTVDEKWLHKNKDHGMMSAAASLGLILLWDVDEGLSQVRLEPFRPGLAGWRGSAYVRCNSACNCRPLCSVLPNRSTSTCTRRKSTLKPAHCWPWALSTGEPPPAGSLPQHCGAPAAAAIGQPLPVAPMRSHRSAGGCTVSL